MPMAIPLLGAAFMAAGSVMTAVGVTAAIAGISLATIATVAGVALMAVSMLTMQVPKPNSTGAQLDTKLSAKAPVPVLYGRTATGGTLIYRELSGTKNDKLFMAIALSAAGPIAGVEYAYANDVGLNFSGQPASAMALVASTVPASKKLYRGKFGQRWLVGDTPSTTTIAQGFGSYGPAPKSPGKASGHALALVYADYDTDEFPQGLPKMLWTVRGVKVYDPRKDSTYPGGSGAHRLANAATWEFSENPYLCALHWTLGKFENGRKVVGIGAKQSEVDLPAFVRGANVADANNWKVGGVAATSDDKFAVLSTILAAGAGVPIARGAQISCHVNTPLTTTATITAADIVRDVEIQNSSSLRSRYNTVIPTYREPSQFWEIISGQQVSSTVYVEEDGGFKASKEVEFPMVQQAAQAHQLATYNLVNSREMLTFTCGLKLRALSFRVGDAVVVNVPEIASGAVKCLVINREYNPSDQVVTLTLKSENDAKHAFALGQSQVAPPTIALTGYDASDLAGPETANWIVSGSALASDTGIKPIIRVGGANDNPYTSTIIVEYRPVGSTAWYQAGVYSRDTTSIEITTVTANTAYQVAISYRSATGGLSDKTIFGPVTAGDETYAWQAVTGLTKPQDGATVGAPAGTLVGGIDASQIAEGVAGFTTYVSAVPATVALTAANITSALDSAGNVKMTVKWTALAGITSYEVQLRPTLEPEWDSRQVGATASSTFDVVAGASYTVHVRAISSGGTPGAWSAVVTHIAVKDATPPAIPTAFTVLSGYDDAVLKWSNPGDYDLASVEVWSNTSNASASATKIASLASTAGGTGYFRHTIESAGATRWYWLKAVDASGNASAFSQGFSATSATVLDDDVQVPGPNIIGSINSEQLTIVPVSKIPVLPDDRVSAVSAGKLVTGTVIPSGVLVGTTAVSTILSNAANGNTAFTGTANYRTTGAPTNNPAPSNITITANANGTRNIRLDWAAYSQGARRADELMVFWTKANAAPTVNDSSVTMPMSSGASYYIFEGLNPTDVMSFGIAAARRTENGTEIGTIVAPTASPNWRNIATATPNYTGNINGVTASTLTQALADAASDSVLTPSEKPDLVREYNRIIAAASALIAQAASFSISSTGLVSARDALTSYLTGLSPAWNNTSVNTTVVPSTFNARFDAYYTADANLTALIATAAKSTSDATTAAKTAAETAASTANTKANEAAGSATASATSATNASNSATAAGTSASAADTARTNAETARSQAQTFATNASGSATTAAGSASTATSQAGVASNAAASATGAAKALFPERIDGTTPLFGLNGNGAGAPDAITPLPSANFVADTDLGTCYQITTTGTAGVGFVEVLPMVAGRIYRIEATVKLVSTTHPSVNLAVSLRHLNADYSSSTASASVLSYPTNWGITNTVGNVSTVVWYYGVGVNPVLPSSDAGAGRVNMPLTPWARAYTRVEVGTGSTTVRFARLKITDVTDSQAALGSAAAAAGSASTATTQATAAGTSATAANTAKTGAETARGQAQTYASNASTSADSASTSASTATTQAGLATTAKNDAAGSATAAAGSASTASTQATNAGTSATAANTAKTGAETARGQAQTYAANASTSADNAAGSASTASTSAGVASTSATAAQRAVLATHPTTFEDQNNYFSGDSGQNNTTAGWANEGGRFVFRGGNGSTATVSWRQANPSRNGVYRVRALVGNSGGNASSAQLRIGTYTQADASTAARVAVAASADKATPANAYIWVEADFDLTAFAFGTGTFMRPEIVLGAGAGASNTIVRVAALELVDVTSEKAALGSANAAATSASTASTKATDAGTAATAAQSAQTLAETARGQAQTYASNASTSATNAAGSATTASNQAGVATTAKTDAQNAATAASNSASTASTQATNAGTSATAANNAKTAAETARGQAQTYASNASTSADDAAGSASTASTQAGVASTSRQQAQDAATAASTSAQTASTKAGEASNSATAANSSSVSAASSAAAASLTVANGPILPADFNEDGKYWSTTYTGLPSRTGMATALPAWTTFVTVAGVGRVMQIEASAQREVAPLGWQSWVPGRRYRVSIRHRVLSGTANFRLYLIWLNDASSMIANQASPSIASTATWTTTVLDQLADAPNGTINLRPLLQTVAGTTGVLQVESIQFEDITQTVAAAGSATAAATSAATATTKAGEAGTSATAANTAKTAAETASGNAQTFASNASASATSATGSANTASTQAGVSATNATIAQNAAQQNLIGIPYLTATNTTDTPWPNGNFTAGGDSPPGMTRVAVLRNVGGDLTYGAMVPGNWNNRTYRFTGWVKAPQLNMGCGVGLIGRNVADTGGAAVYPIIDAQITAANTWTAFTITFATTNTFSTARPFVRSTSPYGVMWTDLTLLDVTESVAAASSASAAQTSAQTATTKAGEAGTSASTASTQASNASTSAGNASTYAGQAQTSANTATASKDTAGQSATAAAASALVASTKAGEASTSASNASASSASASTSAASATSMAQLSASVATGGVTANGLFADWTGTYPAGWSNWSGGAPTKLASGRSSPFAV